MLPLHRSNIVQLFLDHFTSHGKFLRFAGPAQPLNFEVYFPSRHDRTLFDS
jgi:hypothetical protein